MKYRLDSIGPEGKSLDLPLPAERVAAELAQVDAGYTPAGPIDMSGRLDLAGRALRFVGRLDGRVTGACRRCLEATEVTVDAPFELTLHAATDTRARPGRQGKDREELGEGERAGSFGLDEADEDVYQGEELDLWPLLREQLLLALPDYLLCREACAGLCQVCGNNLNEEACGCDRVVPDPRLAGLKDIKLS